MIHRYLTQFFKQLEQSIPPPANCHHAMHFAQYGNEQTGYDDRLCVKVNQDGVLYQFILEKDDLARTPSELVLEIMELLPFLQ